MEWTDMHTLWKGAISFGLVNVPVKMFTATQDDDIAMKKRNGQGANECL